MKNMTLESFVALTASKEPVPGGGSISALAGALAAALGEMVAGLTLGKKKYADVQEEMENLISTLSPLWKTLLDDMQRDSESFHQYMEALSLPKDTDQDKDARSRAMQEGLKAAVLVPFSVAEKASGILPFSKLVVEKGNATAVTDGLVSAMMARTAVLGAVYNVKINLKSMKDEAFVQEIYQKATRLEREAEEKEAEIRALAFERLN